MNIIELMELIERKGHYKVYINHLYNCNVELWSSKGIRVFEFKNESEVETFLIGVYYVSVDLSV